MMQDIDPMDDSMPTPSDAKLLLYVGHRPYRQDASDSPLLPGETVGPGHQYEGIIDHLAKRADFVEVETDG